MNTTMFTVIIKTEDILSKKLHIGLMLKRIYRSYYRNKDMMILQTHNAIKPNPIYLANMIEASLNFFD